jgi:hypothetical protein
MWCFGGEKAGGSWLIDGHFLVGENFPFFPTLFLRIGVPAGPNRTMTWTTGVS